MLFAIIGIYIYTPIIKDSTEYHQQKKEDTIKKYNYYEEPEVWKLNSHCTATLIKWEGCSPEIWNIVLDGRHYTYFSKGKWNQIVCTDSVVVTKIQEPDIYKMAQADDEGDILKHFVFTDTDGHKHKFHCYTKRGH